MIEKNVPVLVTIFGALSNGKVDRAHFVLLTLLLALCVVLATIGVGFLAGGVDHIPGASQGVPVLAVLGAGGLLAVILPCAFGTFNLVAKRARDIGWNPLLVVILFAVFSAITWIVLAFMPGAGALTEEAV